MNASSPPCSILVIRRDNIGDLVCTTPLISALRQRFPTAWIGALVNSYNAPVLAGNSALDRVYAYTKFKHRSQAQSWVGSLAERIGMILELRRRRIDTVILAASGNQASAERFARWLAPGQVLRVDPASGGHEVQRIMSCLASWGETGMDAGPCLVAANPSLKAHLAAQLPSAVVAGDGPLVGLHISARKPSQRWSAANFADLARQLHQDCHARFLLFWSPGSERNPLHPGDDEKAATILAQTTGLPIHPVPTSQLEELIAGLALVDGVVCSDGGAMHLAAGLSKPIVCFFGSTPADRWHPWGTPYALLQPDSKNVADIAVAEVVEAFVRLLAASSPR